MTFCLSSANVLDYLIAHQLVEGNGATARPPKVRSIRAKTCKNFNLAIELKNGQAFLLKQERLGGTHSPVQGQPLASSTTCDFWKEWRVQQFLEHFSGDADIGSLRSLTSHLLHFDPQNRILVGTFFKQSCDLAEFYRSQISDKQADSEQADAEQPELPTAIAHNVGETIAQFHQATEHHSTHEALLSQLGNGQAHHYQPRFLSRMHQLGPGIFGLFCEESLEFFQQYQSDRQLQAQIQQVQRQWTPSCLIHRDLRLRNILVSGDCKQTRIIDWEKYVWGDPTYDLGFLLADYLRLSLEQAVPYIDLDWVTALELSALPISALQPSLQALWEGYGLIRPQVLQDQDFQLRVFRYVGVALLQKIETHLEYQLPFGNADRAAMAIAKGLLSQTAQFAQQYLGLSVDHALSLSL